VDISPEACELAKEAVADAGLTERTRIVCGDVLDTGVLREFPEADVVGSFLMLHHLFDRCERPADVMRLLRGAFPGATRFVVADTVRMPRPSDGRPPDMPVFAAGFELVHALMGVTVRSIEEYERAFAEADLRVSDRRPFGAPNTWLYTLVPAGRP
jgi:hypothetical protein